MQLPTFEINHHTAPFSLYEKVVFPLEQFGLALGTLCQHLSHLRSMVRAVILPACSRTEIYCVTDGNLPEQTTHEHAIRWLAQHHDTGPDEPTPHVYSLGQLLVIRHAFRAVSRFDSMVLGEIQVLRQMKNAVRTATEAGALDTYLNQLFQRIFAVAKGVRDTTEVGTYFVSIAAAAIRLAQRIFKPIADRHVLFVSTGRMIELCTTHFAAQMPHEMMITNRTLEHDEKLAESLSSQGLNAHAMRPAELSTELTELDVVMSCTVSTLLIIGLGTVERVIKQRRHRLMFMIDLVVLHDIEPEVTRLFSMSLYTVDDLSAVVREGSVLRQATVAQAEIIIETRVLNFMCWLNARSVVPIIRDLYAQARTPCQGELEYAQHMLARGDDPTLMLEVLSQALIKKFLHGPTRALNHTQDEDRKQFIDLSSVSFRQSSHFEHQQLALRSRVAHFHPGTQPLVRYHAPPSLPAFPSTTTRMKPSMLPKLDQLAERIVEVNVLLTREDATVSLDQYHKLICEHAELGLMTAQFAAWKQAEKGIATAQELATGPDMKAFTESELRAVHERMESLEGKLQRLLLPKDPNDHHSVFVETRASTDGDEFAFFAGDLPRMYTRYTERQRRQVEIVNESTSDLDSYKEVVARLMGKGACSCLKFESGGRRIQHMPATGVQRRIHTLAYIVTIIPETDTLVDIQISPTDLHIDTFCTSGADGQHISKTELAVRVTHLPTGLVVGYQDGHNQHRNRDRAIRILAARLKDRQGHGMQAKEVSAHKGLIGSGDRSDCICMYNLPQGRMTDHRINLTLYKIDVIMDDDADGLTGALTAEYQAEQLTTLGEDS